MALGKPKLAICIPHATWATGTPVLSADPGPRLRRCGKVAAKKTRLQSWFLPHPPTQSQTCNILYQKTHDSTPTSVLSSRQPIEEEPQRPHDALLPPLVAHLVALTLDDRWVHLASVGLMWAVVSVGMCRHV